MLLPDWLREIEGHLYPGVVSAILFWHRAGQMSLPSCGRRERSFLSLWPSLSDWGPGEGSWSILKE